MSIIYCRFGNFRATFISRFFDFLIIREVLNSRASIRVVGRFRGLKLGMQIVVSIKLSALVKVPNCWRSRVTTHI